MIMQCKFREGILIPEYQPEHATKVDELLTNY